MTSNAKVRIQALGGYRIFVDDRDLRLRTRKEALLLLRLALAGDDGVSRDECIGMLWPDSSEARARHSLSEALRGIEMATRLELLRTPERLALPTAVFGFDVRELEAAIAAGDVNVCTRLHKGGFLAGWYPPTAEASHWVDAVAAGIAARLEKMVRRELAASRQATDGRGVSATVALLEQLGVATAQDREAGAEADQITAWESLRPGESIHTRIPIDREGPFVGRLEEMKVLTAELECAMKGEVRVVLVSGEPGIGKTRTCQRLARLAALRGARLFLSTCYELEQSVAYGAISEAFVGLTPTDISSLSTPFRMAWNGTFAGIGGLRERDASEMSSRQPASLHVILHAMTAVFESACRRKPSLLLIDDLQWADAVSCQALHFLLRSLDPTTPGLVVLSYRDADIHINGAARTLARNAESLGAVRLRLAPLSEKDICLQVEGLCPEIGERLGVVANAAGGNPFFARELAFAEAHGNTGVTSVAEVISARISGLPDPEVEALRALAVAAVPLTVLELSVVTGTTSSEALRAVVALENKRLIRDENGAVAVAHELIRAAIYDKLSEALRRPVHASVAATLAGRAAPALLAHHFSLGGRPDEARLHAIQAAQRSRQARDYAEEIRCLLLALDNTSAEIPETLDMISTRMFAVGRFSDAAALLGSYSKHLDRRLRLRKSVAELKSLTLGDAPSGYAICDDVFRRCQAAGLGMEAIEALREKTRLAQEAGDTQLVLACADRLDQFGQEWPDQVVAPQARAIALLKLTTFSPEAVPRRLARLLEDLRCVGDVPRDVQFTVDHVDALISYNEGAIATSGLKFHTVIRRSRLSGDMWQELRARSLLVPVSTEAGRFHRAKRHADFVMEYARYGDAPWEHLVALVNLAWSRWEAGDSVGAQRLALAGVEAERKHPMWMVKCLFSSILGLCALESNQIAEAQRHVDAVAESLPPINEWIADMSLIVVFLSRAWRKSGRTDEAVVFLERAAEHAQHHQRVFYWTVRLELATTRLETGSEEDASAVFRVYQEAALKGCRLVATKAKRLILTHQITC